MIEGQAEPIGDPGLDRVHLGAVFGHRLARLGGGELGGGAVLVGGAEKHHLVAACALVSGKEIGRQVATRRDCPDA